jgi:polar amino acid transport system substrate-binding protein
VRRSLLGWAAVLVGVALLACGLAGCGEARQAASPTFTPSQSGRLLVATALPAPGFWEGETPERLTGGFEWALARTFADRFDLRLEVVDLPFERIAGGDLAGADLAIAQISITEQRSRLLDFSVPYYTTDAGVLAPEGTSMSDLFEARRTRWAAVRGSTEADLLADTVRPGESILLVDDEVLAADAVRTGEVGAALMDLPTALVLAGSRPLEVVARFATQEQYGIALERTAPTRSANRSAVDAVLRGLLADGTIADLDEEWLRPAFGARPDSIPVIRVR